MTPLLAYSCGPIPARCCMTFDVEAQEAYQQSLLMWPVLARLMNLVPRDAADAPAERGEPQESAVE